MSKNTQNNPKDLPWSAVSANPISKDNRPLEEILENWIAPDVLEKEGHVLVASIEAWVEAELKSLKPDGKNLSTSAYGLWVAHELDIRIDKLRGEHE